MAFDYYMGVDPGKNGAIALITFDGQKVLSLQKLEATDVDTVKVITNIKTFYSSVSAVIEKLQANAFTKASYSIGYYSGLLKGAMIANQIRFEEETPNSWQRAMKCQTKGDKHITKALAQKLFPGVHITLETADALILAEYARRKDLGLLKEAKIL